ncbi:cysteine dioxygenase [Pectinophora gossypiella]|uniref:cysteine dioxygenase n=1 Tax=Pectinophora gossypiella TaxID=13191 RepID=UPI00214ED6E4|nr:cysteine dioxygenase [Pectinophora gossypiella]
MDIENVNCKLKVSQCADMEISYIERPIKVTQEITGLEKLVEELHRVFSDNHVNVQDVQKLMAGYKSDPKDWRKYAKFDRFRYTRNLVDCGNGLFNIMILCWGPAHASAIHDHADSHCFMKVLSGRLHEIRYDWPEKIQPEVMKKLNKSRRRCCSESEDKILNDSQHCENDSCHNYGGKIDGQDGGQNGANGKENGDYDPQNMEEIGRTQLEVNDVCYINDALGLHRMENPSHVDGCVSLHLYCPPFDSCRVFDARTGKPTEVKVTFWSMYGKKINRVIEATRNDIADSQ